MKQKTSIAPSDCHLSTPIASDNERSFHSRYGLSLPTFGWVPSPTYLLRRKRILHHLNQLPAGRVLEIGCGAGALIDDFLRRYWDCVAVDDSDSAQEILQSIYHAHPAVQVHRQIAETDEKFDLIAAFEVLEHIEDDVGALRHWVSHLKPSGVVMLSFPAHRHRWNATDEWAGHYRRYDRSDVDTLLSGAGLRLRTLECYGFPLGNIIEPIRTWIKTRKDRSRDSALSERTARSGTERPFEMKLYPFLCHPLGVVTMEAAFLAQRPFLSTNRGVGYFVVAEPSESSISTA